MNELGRLYFRLGRNEETLAIWKRALEIRERAKGGKEDHDIGTSRHLLLRAKLPQHVNFHSGYLSMVVWAYSHLAQQPGAHLRKDGSLARGRADLQARCVLELIPCKKLMLYA